MTLDEMLEDIRLEVEARDANDASLAVTEVALADERELAWGDEFVD